LTPAPGLTPGSGVVLQPAGKAGATIAIRHSSCEVAMLQRFPSALWGLCLASVLAAGCASKPEPPTAVAMLNPTTGQKANGIVRMAQEGDRVVVRARVAGLTPNREHGFHVHEKGDCSAPDAGSAGEHLNPEGKPHGPPHGERHAGDLPSLKADTAGVAATTFEVKGTLLGAGAADLIGKALVVHADPDDYASQPAGNSGSRIACGVIASPVKPGGIGGNSESKTIPKQM
jgi:superoxide dismutase, Cu-Zn family